MNSLDLPVFAISSAPGTTAAGPMAAGPLEALAQTVVAGMEARHPAFADALAGLTAAPAGQVAEDGAEATPDTGKDLPDWEQPTGNSLPEAAAPLPAPPVPVLPLLLQPVTFAFSMNVAQSAPPVDLPPQTPPVLPQADPSSQPLANEAAKAAFAANEQAGGALQAELTVLAPRTSDAGSTLIAVRDAPPSASLQSSVPAASSPVQLAPGAQLEQLVEALAQARETGKGARGDIAVRHADFGLLAIRVEADGGETRAQITARDPGFAPAVVAALAERANAGAGDQQSHQRGQDQSWGQQGSAHSDPRQHERRQNSAETRAVSGDPASGPASGEPDQLTRTDQNNRFA